MPYWSMENVPWTNMHDLNLDWIINTMKQTVEQWIAYRTQMDSDWQAFQDDNAEWRADLENQWTEYQTEINSDFNELQEFILNYFATLDLSDEVSDVIARMVNSGEFLTLIQPSISTETASWLASHITNPSSVVIDSSLTVAGAAADAKAAGDPIRQNASNILSILTDQSGEYPLDLTFINGRYSSNGTVLGQPSSHSRTLSSTTAIRYDDVNFTINLKTGYMVAFPSFNNGVQVGTSIEFITTVGEITLAQIKANCAVLGDSFAIMLRTNPEATISPSLDITTAITKQIQMPAMVFNGALHGTGLTLSDYRKAGWYTLNSTAAQNATDGFPGLASNIIGGVLQNFTNIGESQNIITQRYSDRGSFKQAFERTITVPVSGDITVEDWRVVQNRLALLTQPTIEADIDITSGYTMGIYRVAAGVNINGASNTIPGYSMTAAHVFISIMDSSGRFTYCISGSDGVWFKPTGTEKFYRLDAITSGMHTPTTWVAIGDSITDGRYSYYDGDHQAQSGTNHTGYYGYIAAKMLGFKPVIEYGYGGMGWLHAANDGTYLTDILDDMNLGTPDLITVCLGINDRNSGSLGDTTAVPGDGTISGAIRYCIETLCYKYPSAQVILITPINARNKGSISTGWSKRTAGNNLDDMADIIKYWCNYYSVKCIDALNECPINVYNIEELMPDGLHPSAEAHVMIARWLAGALPRRD